MKEQVVPDLLRSLGKMFSESRGDSQFWNNEAESVDKEQEDMSRVGCFVNGRYHGRHGTWLSRSKRRHASFRREVKVVGDQNGSRKDGGGRGREEEKNGSRRGGGGTLPLYSLVLLLSVLCYLNSLQGDFVHDDLSAIKGNEDVSGQTGIGEIFLNDFWGKPMADPNSHKSYRPLTILTFR